MIPIEIAPPITEKEGVDFDQLTSLLKIAVYVVRGIYEEHGYDYVLTSTTEGKHRLDSYHYTGHAFDSRIRHIKLCDAPALFEEITKSLQQIDRDFEIIVESTHLHIELDRRYKNHETQKNEKQQTLL